MMPELSLPSEVGTTLTQAMAGFFFHDRGTSLQKSLIGLLRGLLFQILCQYDDLVLKVLPMFSKSCTMGGNTLWSGERELKQALAAITAQQDVLGEVCLLLTAWTNTEVIMRPS